MQILPLFTALTAFALATASPATYSTKHSKHPNPPKKSEYPHLTYMGYGNIEFTAATLVSTPRGNASWAGVKSGFLHFLRPGTEKYVSVTVSPSGGDWLTIYPPVSPPSSSSSSHSTTSPIQETLGHIFSSPNSVAFTASNEVVKIQAPSYITVNKAVQRLLEGDEGAEDVPFGEMEYWGFLMFDTGVKELEWLNFEAVLLQGRFVKGQENFVGGEELRFWKVGT